MTESLTDRLAEALRGLLGLALLYTDDNLAIELGKEALAEYDAARQRVEAAFDEAACRREFEAWAKSERMILTVDHPPHYAISEVRHAWYAWLAARRAAPSAGAIPADWQLVPKEPTREMQLAGQQRIPPLQELKRRSTDSFAVGGYPDEEWYWYQPWSFAVVAYKAMLEAAPQPQQQEKPK